MAEQRKRGANLAHVRRAEVGLTPKEARFCEEYLVDLNITAAAIRAGYSERGARRVGWRLMQRERVQAQIRENMEALSKRTGLDQEYVVTNLQEVVERCMQRAPVMVRRGRALVQAQDEEGRDVWQFDAQGAIGAVKLLGQHLGMFNRAKLQVHVDLDKLTDAQLEHLAGGGGLDDLPR